MKRISEIRKKYNLNNTFFAEVFGYKNLKSFNESSGKKKVINGIIEIVNAVEKTIDNKKTN